MLQLRGALVIALSPLPLDMQAWHTCEPLGLTQQQLQLHRQQTLVLSGSDCKVLTLSVCGDRRSPLAAELVCQGGIWGCFEDSKTPSSCSRSCRFLPPWAYVSGCTGLLTGRRLRSVAGVQGCTVFSPAALRERAAVAQSHWAAMPATRGRRCADLF